MEIKSDMDTRT